MNEYRQHLAMVRNGFKEQQGPKPSKRIKQISDKKAVKMKEAKKASGDNVTIKEKWFKARRRELTGICQCGCAMKSSKDDDATFRSSCCHIFPQRIFESVQFHPLNCVERNFWDGCHSNMDNRSLDKWPMMADWEDIKERFHILAPELTDEERASKFYGHLERLVYSN